MVPPLGRPDLSARLVTLAISHYCEKARWALDRAGIAFLEERHIQGIHMLASRRAGGHGTVPVLRSGGTVLGESAQIVRWADARGARLLPADAAARARVEALARGFDQDLGVQGRRWMYWEMLPHPELLASFNCLGVPAWEARGFRAAYPILARLGRRALDITPEPVARARERVHATFDAVAQRLADGRPHLTGDAFTAADLTFAALSASVLVPPQYGSPLPQPGELPAGTAREVRALREHPAGRFALRLYAEERGVRAAGPRAPVHP